MENINKIYFLYESYSPNTAWTNRALAYLRNIEQMKVPVEVVYFLPDAKKSRLDEVFHYVHVSYCWDNWYLNHKLFKYISYWKYVKSFLRQLKEGDKVYIYGLNDIIGRVINKKGIEVYYEGTESPEVSLSGSWLHHPTLNEHIELCKRTKGLIVISKGLRDYYINKGVSSERIHIVNMTVDSSRFDGLKKKDGIERYIAYCGTASNNKDGVDKLIRSFAIVSKNHSDLKLYIIGSIPNRDDKSVNQKLIRDLGVEDKIVFTGLVPAEQIPQLLKNAEMLALARPNNIQAKYGFPTKLGEYLLTGNPVVVTSVGDIPLFLKDGESALIANPDSNEDFAAKMEWVLTHPYDSSLIGEKGRKVALNNFNAEIETEKLIDIIKTK